MGRRRRGHKGLRIWLEVRIEREGDLHGIMEGHMAGSVLGVGGNGVTLLH